MYSYGHWCANSWYVFDKACVILQSVQEGGRAAQRSSELVSYARWWRLDTSLYDAMFLHGPN